MRGPIPCLLLVLAIQLCAGERDFLSDLVFFDTRSGNAVAMGPVNAETVTGFELLYATPGTGDISEIAGHLLLRVKLRNNPRAEARGMENPHDLVISFLADTEATKPKRAPQPVVVREDCRKRNWFNLVQDNQADGETAMASVWQSLRGLSGGFEITMDRQTLDHALKSYTVEQDRDLIRYELTLTDAMETDLIRHLFHVRDHYRPHYYFFSQNCGSVLVKVIGEGIGDEDIATFDPLVSPPHTLVGNLIRKGLARPVTPSFYSYRKEGFIARRIFRKTYDSLTPLYPDLPWPATSALFARNEPARARAVRALDAIALARPGLAPDIYRLAALFQESDMVFDFKGLNCEDYTGASTAEARHLQARILREADDLAALQIDLPGLVRQEYAPIERAGRERGRPHTQHYTVTPGLGFYRADGAKDGPVLTLDASLLKQDMGSTSSIAMQRGSAVELGGASIVADDRGVREWRATGLRLQKFRDTLRQVDSCFESTRGLGLGLTVLDIQHRELAPETHGVLGGIAVLGNLMSSAHHNDFLFASVGLDLAYHDYHRHQNLGVACPLGIESLVTIGDLQWRSAVEFTVSTRSDNGHELQATSSLAYYLGEFRGSEIKLHGSLDHQTVFAGDRTEEDHDRLLGQVRLEINHW